MYLSKGTANNLSKVDKSKSMSCVALILNRHLQIPLTILQLQKMQEVVSGTYMQKAQLGEFFSINLKLKNH